MRRMLGMMLAMLVLFTGRGWASDDVEIFPLGVPDHSGDQLIFYYDARPDFTTFLTIHNESDEAFTAGLLLYGPTFGTPLTKTIPLAAGALTIVDVGAYRGVGGLPAQVGVAFATFLDSDGRPISTGAMVGSFTIANLLTGSAFGAPAAARTAFRSNGLSNKGDLIDGVIATFQRISPDTARIAGYYDPTSLAPPTIGGNQLIFVNFEDSYAPAFGAASGSTTWDVFASRSDGFLLPRQVFTAAGVSVSDLASVAGAAVNGAAGSLTLVAQVGSPTVNRLVYFAESLGTFGTGYLVPPATRN